MRSARPDEAPALWRLLHETVHYVNLGDYTEAEVQAWAPANIDAAAWARILAGLEVFVAECGPMLVGFGTLSADGCVVHLFSHWSWQRRGAGRALLARIEEHAREAGLEALYADVSVTARPFFASMGFQEGRSRTVERGGEHLLTTRMAKRLTSRPAGSDPGG